MNAFYGWVHLLNRSFSSSRFFSSSMLFGSQCFIIFSSDGFDFYKSFVVLCLDGLYLLILQQNIWKEIGQLNEKSRLFSLCSIASRTIFFLLFIHSKELEKQNQNRILDK